jgi:DNA polymerase-1
MHDNDKRLFLLDAYALIYRAYYAFSKYNPKTKEFTGLINSKGVNVSAIYGFVLTLLDLLEKEKPSHIAVVFDTDDATTDRALEYEFYKANREAMPEDISQSIPVIKQILEAFEIPTLQLSGYEADDIVGTIAKQKAKEGYTVYMVTPDKDYGQLVEDRIYMYKPGRQGSGVEILGVKEVCEKWQIERPEQVIDMLGLMGDSVDNIPGIPGVGEKTAQKLIAQFGSLEGVLEGGSELKGKLKERIEDEENQKMARISKELATIILDVPIEVTDEDLTRSKPDKEKLEPLFVELEFRTLGKRVFGEEFSVNKEAPSTGQMDLFGGGAEENSNSVDTAEEKGKDLSNVEHDYKLANDEESLGNLFRGLKQVKSFAFDTETTGLNPLDDEIVGLSLSWNAHDAWYIPFPEDREEAKSLMEQFKPVFEDRTIEKVGQNIKFDMHVLSQYGVKVKGPIFDTMLAHYLIEPDRKHNMDYLAETYLGYSPMKIENLIGKRGPKQGSMRDVDLEKITEYAAEDADITWQLKGKFEDEAQKGPVSKVLNEIELPLVPVLQAMEAEGVAIDRDFLEKYSEELNGELIELRDSIFKEAGHEFNLDSPKQLGTVLFEEMGVEYKGKKTKTGQYSTSEDQLSKIDHPVVERILEYREITKLRSTYVEALPKLINDRTGRIHTTFNQTVAATGQLSSQNPNLQNIPIRTERGRRVRKAFIPRDNDHILLAADYSQIELRLIAALSGDETMLEAFRNGQDIHATTASKVFGVDLDDVTREMRSHAKTVNFGIIYGVSAYGLSQQTDLSRTDSAEIIENYFKTYPGIKAYMDHNIEKAREQGFVETIMGRRRYLRDINSRNQGLRGHAERNAINAPVQGSAADMIKLAMINIQCQFEKAGIESKMTLQVHDELVFDVLKSELEDVKAIVIEQMKTAIDLDVPIEVEAGTGSNWLEAH